MVAYINRFMATQELKLTHLGIITRTPFLHAIGGGRVEPRLEVLATWPSGGFLYGPRPRPGRVAPPDRRIDPPEPILWPPEN